ncbi:thiol-disulfide oxidoreductase ResA [Niallia nealsonii]|uniref:Thiol-disulfide oxidoreductase n=1 Tax=Niallia nealsonii TaxID=115979 RepID=A0A2N0Z3S3_9BACI|nr:thiol-disulfide oxidoreductase ResA [Niallia nealsonii]PKG24167.1 thiol-disulfide oxidoreductase [Niallia nealsonii]
MKKKRLLVRSTIFLLISAAALYTIYASITNKKADQLQVGQKAPDFILVDQYGKKQQLDNYKGQGVFLNFWATWCKPCETEMPLINKVDKKYSEKGIQVLSINIGESSLAVDRFIEKYQLDFSIMNDANEGVQDSYAVNPLPASFFIDKDGMVKVIYTGELTEEKMEALLEKIKP